jgi:hypothetical protein
MTRIGLVATPALALLALVPCAAAGGSQVDLALQGGRVWVVGDAGLRELSAADGRTLDAPAPVGAAYDLSVAIAGGAAWVASVANGDVDGRLTRLQLRTHRERVVLHEPEGSVQYVAGGAGSVWALVGRRSGNELVRLTYPGRVEGRWGVGDGGRMTADAGGCWVSANGRLLHVADDGRLRVAARVPFGDIAAGGGAVWVGLRRSLVRIDERTGAVRTFPTSALGLGGFQHDMAVGNGYLWTLGTGTLARRDPRTARVLQTVRIPRIADAVAVSASAVWIGTTHGIVRLDPRTLRTSLRIAIT